MAEESWDPIEQTSCNLKPWEPTMAQGLLERVVTEAKAAAPKTFFDINQRPALTKQLYGVEELSFPTIIKHQFPPVALDALRKFRTKEGWPALAIFSLDSPTFEVSYDPEDDRLIINPTLQYPLWECFWDIKKTFRQYLKSKAIKTKKGYYRVVRLKTEFNGLIPADIKSQIQYAKPLFDKIFVEQQEWTVNVSKPIPIGDPLVVGWTGQGLYLIAEFDTTPVEEALLLEGPANKQK
jgi:hypothetical protein